MITDIALLPIITDNKYMHLPDNLDINSQFKEAIALIENENKNVFVTGRAGTGKSTLLEYFRRITKKKIAVLAPTGVAALNIKGQTVHSFFRFKPDINIHKIRKPRKKNAFSVYKNIDAIVIDEISMVRSDLLDCVDKFLRYNGPDAEKPFGGIQMVFIGDLYQLPPVVTSDEKKALGSRYNSEYFFDAAALKDLPIEMIELEKIYRQKDEAFIGILNAFRNNTVDETHLAQINSVFNVTKEHKGFYITLTSTNKTAEEINEIKLSALKHKEVSFEGCHDGEGRIALPAPAKLNLKEGAQVMMLNNDSLGRWVNGTIGKIIGMSEESVLVEFEDGSSEEVLPYTWELFNYSYDKVKDRLRTDPAGSFTQLPLKLAWAVTIHKSQGLTFDKVVIDIGKGTFAHGQLYVALSRCRTMKGIILRKKLEKKHIISDWRVSDFLTKFRYKISEESLPLEEKIKIIRNAIEDHAALEITYLKRNDEKSKRIIKPMDVGSFDYKGKSFPGVSAHCMERNDIRMFRVDRILDIKTIETI